MAEIIFRDESYQLLGACFEVYNEMGCGFLEPVYQECLAIEFDQRGIPFWSKKKLALMYKGVVLKQWYEPDFICFGEVVIEIKSVNELLNKHRAQVHNYLKATGLRLGLLVNFGQFPKLQSERIVR